MTQRGFRIARESAARCLCAPTRNRERQGLRRLWSSRGAGVQTDVFPPAAAAWAMRLAAMIPSADSGAALAASTGAIAAATSPSRLIRHACHCSPDRLAARRRHWRSNTPHPACFSSAPGKPSSTRSHATKSLSGSRYRRQQQRPSASTKSRCARNASLTTLAAGSTPQRARRWKVRCHAVGGIQAQLRAQ